MQYHTDDADDDYDHDDTCNISNVGVNDVEHSGKSLQVEPSLWRRNIDLCFIMMTFNVVMTHLEQK